MNSFRMDNNNGWILCSSKRFPGKFYYYNVVSGESVWTFNENEKKAFRIDDRTKFVTHKWHSYPEPKSPCLPSKSLNCFTRNNLVCPPKFGHASFPQYFSPVTTQANQIQRRDKVQMRSVDIQTDIPQTEVIVQSCKEPLSERFCKYQYEDEGTESRKISFISRNNKNEDSVNKSDSVVNAEPCNSGNELNVAGNACGSENLFLSNQNSVKNKSGIEDTETNKVHLAENDLRYTLQARKAKLKSQVTEDIAQNNTVKKVRFNLISDVQSDYEQDDKEIVFGGTFSTPNSNIKASEQEKPVTSKIIVKEQCIKDDLRNIKIKVTNSKNITNQPFRFKQNETVTSDTKNLFTVNNDENSLNNLFNNNENGSTNDNESYDIFNKNIVNVTKDIKEKLYIKPPFHMRSVENSNALFPKSFPQRNIFKKYKTTPNSNEANKPKYFPSGYANATSNLFESCFKLPNKKKYQRKERPEVDTEYYNPKRRIQSSKTRNFIDNSVSSSECNDQRNIRYDTSMREECDIMKYCEPDKTESDSSILNKLKQYYTRNRDMEKIVEMGMDEVVCRFEQTMEDLIYSIIWPSSHPALYDAILCLQSRFGEHTHILQILNMITDLDLFSPKSGHLKKVIHPHEVIKAIGCGVVFIEALNELQEFDVTDAEELMLQLIADIQEPPTTDLPEPAPARDAGEEPDKDIFIKKRSDVVEYLQKHFSSWEDYENGDDEMLNENTSRNILTTTGKDLHLIKINNKNEMYRDQNEETKNSYVNSEKQAFNNKIIRKFNVMKQFENRISEFDPEFDLEGVFSDIEEPNEVDETNNKKIVRKFNFIKKFENRIKDDPVVISDDSNPVATNQEKVVRNFKAIKKFENKISEYNAQDNIDESKLSNTNQQNISATYNESNIKVYESVLNDFGDKLSNMESSLSTGDFPVLTIDEGHYSKDEAEQYFYVIKKFLMELSSTLLLMHSFIGESLERLRGRTSDADRRALHAEAADTYHYLKTIVVDLKSIIEREERDENGLRLLIMCAEGALEDKRISNYRQVVAKCLEQARIVGSCLRLLLRATDRACVLSDHDSDAGGACLNIFDRTTHP